MVNNLDLNPDCTTLDQSPSSPDLNDHIRKTGAIVVPSAAGARGTLWSMMHREHERRNYHEIVLNPAHPAGRENDPGRTRRTFMQAVSRLGWGAAEREMTRSAAAASSPSDDQAPHRRPTICNQRGPSFPSLDGTSPDELLSQVRNGGAETAAEICHSRCVRRHVPSCVNPPNAWRLQNYQRCHFLSRSKTLAG